MSEVQTETVVASTPPPTFGDLEAKSQANAKSEATPPVETKTETKPDVEKAPATAEVTPKDVSAEKPADEKKPDPKEQGKEDKPAPPEKYELKLSETSLLNKAALDRVAAYAKAQGLSQEDAQSVVKAQEEDVAAFVTDQKAQWMAEALADKEIGGENLKENLILAKQIVDRFASPALKKNFTDSGYGNHPEMVRMLVKIGKASANDKAIIPRSTPSSAGVSVADRMYDKSKPNN